MKQSKVFKLCSNLIRNNRGSVASGSSGKDGSATNVPNWFTPSSPNPSPLEKEFLNDRPKICKTRLIESPPNFPKRIYTKLLFKTAITTLSNSLKIATEPKFDEFCTTGVAINADSRLETAYPSGVCHFLKKLAFNTTKSFQSREETTAFLEKSKVDCRSIKDTPIYAASCHNSGVEQILQFVLWSNFTDEEMVQAREIVSSSFIIGLTKIRLRENLDKFRRELLYSFMKVYFAPKRIIVAGVVVPKENFVYLVKKYFFNLPSILENPFVSKLSTFSSPSPSPLEKEFLKDLPEICKTHLKESPPNFPKRVYAKRLFKTAIMALSNGLKIATEPTCNSQQQRFYSSSNEMNMIAELIKAVNDHVEAIKENANTFQSLEEKDRKKEKKIEQLTDMVMKQEFDLTLLRGQLKTATTDLLYIQGKLFPRSLIELFEDEYLVSALDRHHVALGLNFKKAFDPKDPLMNYKRMGRFEKWSSFLKIKENPVAQQLRDVSVANIAYVINQLYRRLSHSIHQSATVTPSGIKINSKDFKSGITNFKGHWRSFASVLPDSINN